WNTAGVDGEQGADAEHADHQAQNTADNREQNAFGEKLADDTASAGSDRGTDGDFAGSAGGSGELKVRDVGAGDQQNESDCAQENIEGGFHVAHDDFLHWLDREALTRAERSGMFAPELFGCQAERGLRGFQSDSGLQARRRGEEMCLLIAVWVGLEGEVE